MQSWLNSYGDGRLIGWTRGRFPVQMFDFFFDVLLIVLFFLFRRLDLMWFYSLICVLYGAVERGGVLEFYGRGVQQPEKPNSLAFSNLSVYRMKVIFFDVGQKNSVYFMTVFYSFQRV